MGHVNYKSMEANDPHGMANSDPKGAFGRIYVRTTRHCYILHISCGLDGFREDIFKSFN